MLTETKNPESRGSETGHGSGTKVCSQSTVNSGNCQQIISFTVVRKQAGFLTKRISLDEHGEMDKDGKDCKMSNGIGEVFTIPFDEFPVMLPQLTKHQALVHGVPIDDTLTSPFAIVADGKFKPTMGNTIPRTKKHFGYSKNNNSTFMLDVDPAPGAERLTPDAHVIEVDKVLPGFKDAATVRTHSTSSCISDENGNEISGPGAGYHLYFMMPPGADVARFKEIFKVRTWLNGHGFILLSKDGSKLIRNRLFDEFVFSPERLDFVAGAKLADGLTQNRPEPVYIPGGVFDPAPLPDLTTKEMEQYKQLVDDAKLDIAPTAEKVRTEYIDVKSNDLHARKPKIPLSVCRDTITRACSGGDLHGDYEIHLDSDEVVTVAQILKNPHKYDGQGCHDPIEPEKTAGKAQIYINMGKGNEKAVIHTFWHGERDFFLHLGEPLPDTADSWDFEDAEFYIEKISEQVGLSSKQIFEVVTDIFSHHAFDVLELAALKNAVKKHFKINKGDVDTLIKKEDGKETAGISLTHIEIADKYLDLEKMHYPSVVGAEGALWRYGPKTHGIWEQNSIKQCAIAIGRQFTWEERCKKGSDYKAISNLAYDIVSQPDFFSKARYGLPGATMFYSINDRFNIESIPYAANLRQRWKLPVNPALKSDLTQAPLFNQYLKDSFKNDPQQIKKLQEIVGALICGIMKDLQKVVLFYGKGENGKSVMLDILTHIFPPNLRCSIKPENMDREYYQAMLAGKVVNIVGEVEKSKPIKSDFKDIVGCDTPITARLPYQDPFEFLPVCGHVFSTNDFPQTKDHSHGFYRRWAVIHFENKVMPGKRISRLGQKIARAEMAQFLAWGLAGARRLVENHMVLTETDQQTLFMESWQSTGDSVFNFLSDQDAVCYLKKSRIQKKDFYKIYADWCKINAGMHPVGRNRFYERVEIKVKTRQVKDGARVFDGVGVLDWYEGCTLLKYPEPFEHYSYPLSKP